MLYSRDAEADRAFVRDVLGLRGVDAGGGWLIFELPPSELGLHPTDRAPTHELFLICDDLAGAVRALKRRKVRISAPSRRPWGTVRRLRLPSGASLALYQPSHARPSRAEGVPTATRRRTHG